MHSILQQWITQDAWRYFAVCIELFLFSTLFLIFFVSEIRFIRCPINLNWFFLTVTCFSRVFQQSFLWLSLHSDPNKRNICNGQSDSFANGKIHSQSYFLKKCQKGVFFSSYYFGYLPQAKLKRKMNLNSLKNNYSFWCKIKWPML